MAILRDLDTEVRLAAFRFLEEQTRIHHETLPRELLAKGFIYNGRRVPFVGPQGIFKPAVLPEMPLTITTAPLVEGKPRPYEDEIGDDGLIRYCYRGADPLHRDNVGLRLAMQRQKPLIYLYGVVRGEYVATWPAYVVGENRDPVRPSFTVAVDEARFAFHHVEEGIFIAEDTHVRRRYVTVAVQKRLHQKSFSERVLRAYQERCAVCRLRHRELLDAAHILPDKDPRSDPFVRHGLALCKLHHAAFDSNILGIRPDLGVEIREDILREIDGPMLMHGLQGLHGIEIVVPRAAHLRPDQELLAARYEIFRAL